MTRSMRLRLFSASALLLATSLLAQTATAQTPSQTPLPAPVQTSAAPVTPLNPALPTLFIIGDSTARNQADLGWGDHLAALFDTSRINVANRAVAGRSYRTYINEGRLEKVLAEMKPGDYVFLQMGHNDGGDLGGAKPRGDLKGIGEETKDVPQTSGPLAGQTETIHTYGWYARKYIADIRAKQAHPILLTLTIRNIWKDGHIERDFGYGDYIKQISGQEHVPLVDMATVEADKWEALGQEKTAPFYPIDHTHTSSEGADLNAHSVATALRNANSPLVAYLKPDSPSK
jgi:rhamnogalacturonan acetylesterase